MTRQFRVLVANSPRLMRELVIDTFTGRPDFTIVGEVSDDTEILTRVEETHPDFLFIALDDFRERPPVCDTVLRLHPKVNIIAVSPREDRGVRYWASFNIHSDVIESSEEAILDAMRRAGSLAGGVS